MTEQLNWLTTKPNESHRPNGWVRLDKTWARALGVSRECGVYRLRRSELMRRLDLMAREQRLAAHRRRQAA